MAADLPTVLLFVAVALIALGLGLPNRVCHLVAAAVATLGALLLLLT